MAEFEYYLFENFDADEEANNPANPRNFLGKGMDALLSEIAKHRAGEYVYSDCCDTYGEQLIQKLLDDGVLYSDGMKVTFACPVFLKEDAPVLHQEVACKAEKIVDLLAQSIDELYICCEKLNNGFSAQRNLYHILCGMVFDGYFFDYLNNRGALATKKLHPSGLDYLSVIYEKCEPLESLSNGLLCSYNRLINERCALQSFGDAEGNRFDFYRLFRLLEKGNIPEKFRNGEKLLRKAVCGANKDMLLAEVATLVQTGHCRSAVMELLEHFGYAWNGEISVPVYMAKDKAVIMEIEHTVEKCIGAAMADTLMELSGTIEITAVKHGVDKLEIANELYHIVFGSVNEELAVRRIVETPQYIPGEGRYLKCIEVY